MLLQPDLGGREQTVGDRQQPDFAIAMPAPIDGNGFEAEIDGREMGCGGDAGLAQDRGGKKPAKPRRVLQDGDLVPRIQGDDRLQHRRQILRLPKDATPFLEALVFVPVEIDRPADLVRGRRRGWALLLVRWRRRNERAPHRWRRTRRRECWRHCLRLPPPLYRPARHPDPW